jgi:hypothetical protein
MLWTIAGGVLPGLVTFCALAWIVGLLGAGAGLPERPERLGAGTKGGEGRSLTAPRPSTLASALLEGLRV